MTRTRREARHKEKWKVDFGYIEKMVLEDTKNAEKDDPERVLEKYREAFRILDKIDVFRREGVALRKTPYPLNRFTLLLERHGNYQECLKEIEIYEKYKLKNDEVGLSKSDWESIQKRKARMIKKSS